MTVKEQKVKEINDAIKNSSAAMKRKAKAEITKDGNVYYSMLSRNGKYRMRSSFSEIISLLHGRDMRRLTGRYGSGANKKACLNYYKRMGHW